MRNNDYFCRKYLFMYHRELSEQAIISGFRKGDANIIREYFYGYCQAGYYIFDQRYQLREKENLDFMSLAHQRIPLCGARCAEMVQERVWQHHV